MEYVNLSFDTYRTGLEKVEEVRENVREEKEIVKELLKKKLKVI